MNGARGGPVVVCFGTRPQVIKASALLTALRRRVPTIAVDTGQHYDFEMNALLYQQLNVERPDYCLDVGSASHAIQTAAILERVEPILQQSHPRAVVVIGDTNSTLGCALAAAKLRLAVVHVEAGLRAADALLAEEINRRVVDAISSVLCAPTARAADRLRREHLPGRIEITGDIARDVLMRHVAAAPPSDSPALPLPGNQPFAYATLHRAELTGDPVMLGKVLQSLGRLDMPVILPVHPRTMKVMVESSLEAALPPAIHVSRPLGYLESVDCIRRAAVVVTDSGGVQREAYWLGTPCVTVRAETEWNETVGTGANVLVAPEHAGDLAAIVHRQAARKRDWNRDLLGAGNAAERIADAVASAAEPAWRGSR